MKTLIPIILAVLLVPFFIWIFYNVRKESKKITVKTFQDIENEGVPELKCPKCNTYMEVGSILASRALIFRKKYEAFKFVTTGRLIPNTANLGFKHKENLAWRCDNCKLIILDYSCQIKK